ncbi:hypothetical protein AMATHDRAFT_155140 [Amanita thiersii Skay4041]|uniref:Peroxin-3 n=1 Tax=Amanita thiersii Skay4041 TaxID=703135 RepID=A0A2A9NAS4_9AGAR|nr:hypothetical protein AMATHDRAFT_155140 [Amanita thiersii Skay4041]
MLQAVRTYVYDRRKGFATTAGFVSGVYLVRQYVNERLEELKVKMEQERLARENLKRRFQTTQDDVSYTVLALLPTLAEQVMEGMDVESLTQELQSRSKARTNEGLQPRHRTSLSSSVVHVAHDVENRSDAGSTAPSMASSSLLDTPSQDDTSSGLNSWVETAASVHSPDPSSSHEGPSSLLEPLTASVLSMATTTNTESSVGNESRLSDSVTSLSAASDSSSSRTKAELWAEVKMLTFTRTLTTLYSMTLMCLLTTIQLTLLARSKYVNSVLELERDQRLQEQIESQLSFSNLLFGDKKLFERLMSGDVSTLQGGSEMRGMESDGVTEEVERKFLTLSWWILHVGWKDVGERVRRGVDEVFESVSLKTKLAAIDLHRLIRDVRRRVEYEITFEGNKRRVNFLSTLLPPTPEMIQHVLTQGGISSGAIPEVSTPPTEQDTTISVSSSQISHEFDASPATGLSGLFNNPNNPHNIPPSHSPLVHLNDEPFMSLVAEMREIITSSDFEYVLEACLDRATAVLFDGLERSVFVSSETAPGEEVRIRLAGLLPGLSRWSRLALHGLPNELVDNVLGLREVACLSAIVFSKFEEKFS